MKILHVVTSLEIGGAEALMVELIRATPEIEHLVFSIRGPGPLQEKIEGDRVLMGGGSNYLKSLAHLKRIHDQYRPDVIQSWLLHADLLTAIAFPFTRPTPIVWGFHFSHDSANTTRMRLRIGARVAGICSRLAPRVVVACSQEALRAARSWGYPEKLLRVIPNGVNANRFLRAGLNESSKRTVIAPARWHRDKGNDLLFEAWRRVRARGVDGHLLLVGRGMSLENEAVRTFVDDPMVSDSVECLGQQLEMPDLYSRSEIVVMSSRREALPLALCEAMACELVPVVTNVGDMPEVVKNIGIICDSNDSASLADALIQAIEMGEIEIHQRARMARERIIDAYSIESCAKDYSTLWKMVAD